MSSLSTEGINCPPCVEAVTINTAFQICKENTSEEECSIIKQNAEDGEISVGDYLDKIKSKCKDEDETCRFQLDELGEFFKEEY